MLRSDPRIHYKMYKAKKNMVYAALFSFAVLGGLSLSQNAEADTVENTNTVPAVQTVTNSAQSTTGATPQSMPTQSAVPTQSSAADVNTVNSAPTVQPVSAQPVVNNQANSASNVSNQTPMTTLNAQSARSAQNLAVTSRANLYAQNLAQITQNQAQNVNLAVSSSQEKNTTYTTQVSTDTTWNLTGSFTVTSDQMKAGQPVTIADVKQYATDGAKSKTYPRFNVPANFHVYKDGMDYGYIWATDSATLMFTPNSKLNLVGAQNLNFDIQGGLNLSWQTPASAFQKIPQTIHYQLANVSFNVTYTAPFETHLTGGPDSGFVNSIGGIASVFYLANPTATADDYTRLLQSGGTANVKTRSNYNWGAHIASDHPLLQISSYYALIPTVDIDPTTHQAYVTGWVQENRPGSAFQVADNLSLQQLKSQNSQPGLFYSKQSDGSINVWVNAPATMAKQDANTIRKWVAEESWYPLMHNLDRNKVADATIDYIQNSSLHGLPIGRFGQYLTLHPADPSVSAKITATFYNGDLQTVNSGTSTTLPASSMASGQAAVKLHVINATNGTELNQWSKLIDEARYGK